MSTPLHIHDADFEKVVLQSSVPVIVDFWASWCVPCRMLAPSLETLSKEYGDRLKVVKLDTDQNPQWAMHYGVQGIPTLLFVAGGQIVHTQVGVVPLPALRQLVASKLEPSMKPAPGA